MNIVRSRRRAGACTAVAALTVGAFGALGLEASSSAASAVSSPIVRTGSGVVRGVSMNGGDAFLGLPYAAPPTGNLRWRPPRAPADWSGIRSASSFGPSCPQPAATAGPQSEDCLYLNVYTSNAASRWSSHPAARPVLVWIHGGGFVTGAGSQYDGSKLAADGTVVVTINYRLGALGFLAHPALASRPGGPAGNYGLMDQQAALNWVHDNIRAFGGDPHNVTIAGESAGGLAVLAHLISPGSRGLFQRAIVESGSFGLHRQSLSEGEASGEAFAAQAGCATQTAACLRSLPTATLLDSGWPSQAPESAIVDGKVITESFDTALKHGRFAKVPVLNGTNHNEEAIFVLGLDSAVAGGKFVSIPYRPVSAGELPAEHRRRAGRVRCACGGDRGRVPRRRVSRGGGRAQRVDQRLRVRMPSPAVGHSGPRSGCPPSPTSSTTTRPRAGPCLQSASRPIRPSSDTSSTCRTRPSRTR